MATEQKPWAVAATKAAMQTINPIRMMMESMKMTPNPDKETIPLSIGDPAVFGNLDPDPTIKQALANSVLSGKGHGYAHSAGFLHAREAVAHYASTPSAPLTANDVSLSSGASGALELAIPVLAEAGDNILLPRPGFSLYVTICDNHGIEPKYYNLLPDKSWTADVAQMESLIDSKTKAILVNNPSNPCGSVFPKEHIEEIIALAEKYRLPIISDEIYAHMVFTGNTYYSFASLSKNVPILEIGGLAKRFLVPGWRLGWVLLHDRNEVLKEVREGLFRLTTLILGANTHIQDALPDILSNTPKEFFATTLATLEEHAHFSANALKDTPGLSLVVPQGAMYMMVGLQLEKFKNVTDDVDFAQQLMNEESVFVLPAKCFGAPNFFRIVFCAPKEKIAEACGRIDAFCRRHTK